MDSSNEPAATPVDTRGPTPEEVAAVLRTIKMVREDPGTMFRMNFSASTLAVDTPAPPA